MDKSIKYVANIIITSWNKELGDFECFITQTDVDINNNENALMAAQREVKHYDIKMFRHIAVFDNQTTFSDDYVISNIILAITNNINNYNTPLYQLKKLDSNDKYYEILHKTKTIIDYDIYSQIFDTKKFSSDFIISLLGEKFTTSELIKLAKWSNRQENKTTFYRNIDTNYKFKEKVGRNKYYEKN